MDSEVNAVIFQETFFENNQPENPLLHIRQAGVVQADPNYSIERSGSLTNVLGYIKSGILIEETADRIQYLQQGDCFLLPYETDYRIYADRSQPPILKWLNIRGSLFNSLLDNLFGKGAFPSAPIHAEGELDQAVRLIAEKTDQFSNLSQLIFRLLLELHAAEQPAGSPPHRSEESTAQKYDAYICQNVQYPFSVQKMARHFGISTDALNRTFRRELGATPYRYYQNVRISLAESLLKNTELTIEDIASRLNFIDRNYFSLYFKKCTGCSPALYRKSRRAL